MALSLHALTEQLTEITQKLSDSKEAAATDIARTKSKFVELVKQKNATTLNELKEKAKDTKTRIEKQRGRLRDLKKKVSTQDISQRYQDEFDEHEKEYNKLSLSLSISFESLLDAYYLDLPISNGISNSCGEKNCKTCQHMTQTMTFTSNATKETWKICQKMNCLTKNVIYLFTCERCKLQYVGMTNRKLRERVNLHRSNWHNRQINQSSVAAHVSFNNHTFDDLSLIAIEHNNKWTTDERRARERFWIHTLNTSSPFGMNHN